MVREGYKETELGEIPEDWDISSLASTIEIKHGYAFKSEFFSDSPNDIICLVPGNFSSIDGLYFTKSNTKYYTGKFESWTKLNNGDLLIVMTDLSPKMLILGKTAELHRNEIVLHNQRIGKIEIKVPNRLFSKFLRHILNSNIVRAEICLSATGTTVKHTSPEKIKKHP